MERSTSQPGATEALSDPTSSLQGAQHAAIRQVIDAWRRNADACYRHGDARDDPYDDVADAYKTKARLLRRCADEIEAALSPSGEGETTKTEQRTDMMAESIRRQIEGR